VDFFGKNEIFVKEVINPSRERKDKVVLKGQNYITLYKMIITPAEKAEELKRRLEENYLIFEEI